MSSGNPLAAFALARVLVGEQSRTDAVPEPAAQAEPQASGVFLVEHYVPDVSDELIDVLTRRLAAAARELRAYADVRLLCCTGLPGDEACLCVFAAPSVEAVARMLERAELPADRIVPAVWRAGLAS